VRFWFLVSIGFSKRNYESTIKENKIKIRNLTTKMKIKNETKKEQTFLHFFFLICNKNKNNDNKKNRSHTERRENRFRFFFKTNVNNFLFYLFILFSSFFHEISVHDSSSSSSSNLPPEVTFPALGMSVELELWDELAPPDGFTVVKPAASIEDEVEDSDAFDFCCCWRSLLLLLLLFSSWDSLFLFSFL